MTTSSSTPSIAASGIGLRAPHVDELLAKKSPVGFVEAHSENYFGGGENRAQIRDIAKMYPVTLHGVGLSLGRADGLDQNHLRQIADLAKEINPLFISEHLTWSGYSHSHVPDLLPIPFTNEALDVFAQHVNDFQEAVGRQILVENPSNYLAFADLDYSEPDFLNALVEKTGCGLLLDINNIAVSANNLGYNPNDYIDNIRTDAVKQFHLAGYEVKEQADGSDIYLDTHGLPVYDDVWQMYKRALKRFGDTPTLIEWDTDIPALDVLEAEAEKANVIRREMRSEQGLAPQINPKSEAETRTHA